ncbi:hypothetical protein M413DRAFT_32542 [Hebeloma cylindrosporum]|uniref:Uncharacterized protein n=1 Tax=Hebeloma cylindrosporum TaxID=76867 RepID=A0A0C3BTC7_HEBCY|nr:hypothetical protein M413DRAFT_32542 [Hebeloma cylindrosporum h7]
MNLGLTPGAFYLPLVPHPTLQAAFPRACLPFGGLVNYPLHPEMRFTHRSIIALLSAFSLASLASASATPALKRASPTTSSGPVSSSLLAPRLAERCTAVK